MPDDNKCSGNSTVPTGLDPLLLGVSCSGMKAGASFWNYGSPKPLGQIESPFPQQALPCAAAAGGKASAVDICEESQPCPW